MDITGLMWLLGLAAGLLLAVAFIKAGGYSLTRHQGAVGDEYETWLAQQEAEKRERALRRSKKAGEAAEIVGHIMDFNNSTKKFNRVMIEENLLYQLGMEREMVESYFEKYGWAAYRHNARHNLNKSFVIIDFAHRGEDFYVDRLGLIEAHLHKAGVKWKSKVEK